MKVTVLALLLALVVSACHQEKKYEISGSLPLPDQTILRLEKRIDGAYVTIDSATINEGSFLLTGTVDIPEEYYLSLSERDKTLFFLENAPYSVQSDSASLIQARISGGKTQELYNEYARAYKEQYDRLLKIYYASADEPDPVKRDQMEQEADSLYARLQEYQQAFMLEHTSSPVAVYLLTRLQFEKDGDELDSLLSLLDPALSEMNSYRMLSERVEKLSNLKPGKTAPDFTQNDPEGNALRFSDVYRDHRFTLIDFWASWCSPCRAENPNVVEAYRKFQDKGFTVFSVSLDNNRDRWLKAVEDDRLEWSHVSDLKGWGNEAAALYAVNSIPSNFLIDQQGLIVASGLRGEALHRKLEELLSE